MKKDIKLVAFNMYDTRVDMDTQINPYKKLFIKLGIQNQMKELFKILQTSPQDIRDILPQECFARQDINILLKEFEDDIQSQLSSIFIYDDFLPTIDFLKKNGYQTAVVSNLSKPYAHPLTHLSGKGKFDHEILSFEVGEIKPDRKIFLQLEKKSGISPSDTIMIGDSFVSDVKGAHSAGIYPFHIKRSSTGIQDNGRYTQISTLEDLENFF